MAAPSTAELLTRAQAARRPMALADRPARAKALAELARLLTVHEATVLAANAADLAQAGGLSAASQDRLRLDAPRLRAMARAALAVGEQPYPLGERRALGRGPSGIEVFKERVPLGVVAIVYEARPNVTVECAALTLWSGNVVLLRGGKEAQASNRALAELVRRAFEAAGLPPDGALFVEDPRREVVAELLSATGQVDLAIPRGGPALMALVDQVAKVPVIRHGQGVVHVYVDSAAELSMAEEIAFNAKVQRPGVCNAMETLLVHHAALAPLLGRLGPRLAAAGVELRADPPAAAALTAQGITVRPATPQDWDTEFLDLKLAIRTVEDLPQALEHIARHGTRHTASVVTADATVAARFLAEVDASCVLWNASTRFNDGGELGLGAEMGISTSKLHAYGPMSVRELTTEKLVVLGTGQIR